MKYKKLLNITKPYHLTYTEVRKLPAGEVVLLVAPRRLIYYAFGTGVVYDPSATEGVIVPLELLEHYEPQAGKFKKDHLRRVKVVGCVLDDSFSYGDLGEGLALMPLPKF